MTAGMSVYSAFGLSIASELPLPELPPSSGEPQVVIRRGAVPMTNVRASTTDQFIFNTLSGGFHIRDGSQITVDPLKGAEEQAIRVILLGRVMACLLAQRGWLPLHASGVMIDGKAVLFLGESGAGKSTMAAALHARGHIVIADDLAPVRIVEGECKVLPASSRLRLSLDSMILIKGPHSEPVFQLDKYSINLGKFSLPREISVGRLYLLDFCQRFLVHVAPPLLSAAWLSTHSLIRIDRCGMDAMQSHLKKCAAVAENTHVVQLCRRKNFKELEEVVRFIEHDLGAVNVSA